MVPFWVTFTPKSRDLEKFSRYPVGSSLETLPNYECLVKIIIKMILLRAANGGLRGHFYSKQCKFGEVL